MSEILHLLTISQSNKKYDDEYKCIKRLSATYNMPEIEELWLEFERCETKEARFVKKSTDTMRLCKQKCMKQTIKQSKDCLTNLGMVQLQSPKNLTNTSTKNNQPSAKK